MNKLFVYLWCKTNDNKRCSASTVNTAKIKMATLRKVTQRDLNILKEATEWGYKFNEYTSWEEVLINAENYLIDNADRTTEEVTIEGNCLVWDDGMGYEINVTGEFYTYESIRQAKNKGEDFIIVHTVVNTKGEVVDLVERIKE